MKPPLEQRWINFLARRSIPWGGDDTKIAALVIVVLVLLIAGMTVAAMLANA